MELSSFESIQWRMSLKRVVILSESRVTLGHHSQVEGQKLVITRAKAPCIGDSISEVDRLIANYVATRQSGP